MTIEKLPSGAYRIRKQKAGKRYSMVVDYKPTTREAEKLINDEIKGVQLQEDMSFSEAIESYIDLKKNVLSPSTLKDYHGMPNRFSEHFCQLKISQITQIDVQKEVNQLAKSVSPKTVKNYHGMISTVLKTFRPDLVLRTTLPQKNADEMYIPPDEDVKALLNYAKGTEYECAIRLACYGMRRSEICCITAADVSKNDFGYLLNIDKAIVPGVDEKWVTKKTKTVSSTREIYIDKELAELIIKQGKAFELTPNSLTRYVSRFCKENGIQEFHLHSLRHFFVSTLADKGISDSNIIKLSGHSTDAVLKRVYKHAKNVEKAKQEASMVISDIFS